MEYVKIRDRNDCTNTKSSARDQKVQKHEDKFYKEQNGCVLEETKNTD